LVFITETERVYSAVRTGDLNVIQIGTDLKRFTMLKHAFVTVRISLLAIYTYSNSEFPNHVTTVAVQQSEQHNCVWGEVTFIEEKLTAACLIFWWG